MSLLRSFIIYTDEQYKLNIVEKMKENSFEIGKYQGMFSSNCKENAGLSQANSKVKFLGFEIPFIVKKM